MKKALLIGTALAAVLTSCGSSQDEISEAKIVIGENDLSYYTSDDRLSRSIGKMARGCTATHIGNGYVLTAGHCIKSSNCSTSSYDVTWNYRENNQSGDFTSRCTEVVAQEFSNYSDRDYAILRYDRTPEESISVNLSQRPRQGDRLTILSHPQGIPLAWSGWCSHGGEFDGDRFSYQCDTAGGSSGAVVLNENLEVVGVHNLGSGYYQVNAGTYVLDIPAFQ